MKTNAGYAMTLLATGILLLAGCTRPFPETDSTLWALQAVSSGTASSSTTASYAANGIAIEGNTSLFTSESGTVEQFEIVLLRQPTADVTLPISVSDSTEELISADGSTYTA